MYMGEHIHRLVSKDTEAMTGICKNCGPVKLANKSGGRVACAIAVREQKGHYTPGAGYQSRGVRTQKIRNQSGKCGICGNISDNLHRDHDHTTGKDRAFLCFQCNVALGNLRDSANLAEAIAVYLRWHDAEETWFPEGPYFLTNKCGR